MKLTSEEIQILTILVEDKLEDLYSGSEKILAYWKPEIMHNLLSKLTKALYED